MTQGTIPAPGRWRSWLLQGLLGLAVVGALAWLVWNAKTNLAARGIASGFDFLDGAARFPISESWLVYDSADTFGWAITVGLVNTVVLSALVIGLSTLAALPLAMARRSMHPILAGIASAYVEVMRNTPLVVQLLFWYGLITISFPQVQDAWQPVPGVYLSMRGMALPSLQWAGGIGLQWPVPTGLSFEGGLLVTPELGALVIGLVVYSTAFSGEIIRGGIDAVPRGQWEAGRALGLRQWPLLRQIVLPQALRTIIPPLTSQYLTITKNTTLALAVGYPDLGFVIATTINQTGQAVEGLLLLMGIFLTLSLAVSALMGWYNRRVLARFA